MHLYLYKLIITHAIIAIETKSLYALCLGLKQGCTFVCKRNKSGEKGDLGYVRKA